MSHIRQATGSIRASRRVAGNPRRTDPENSPEQRIGEPEAPVYRTLAAAANDAGYPGITPSAVHYFAKARLIPPTSDRRSLGRAGFVTGIRPAVLDQLLALCAFRKETKSHKDLAVLLWSSGWDVPLDVLKAALLHTLPDTRPSTSEAALDRLDRAAIRLRRRVVRRLRPGHMGGAAGDDAVATLVPAALGILEHMDDAAAAGLERLTGLDRARRDSAPGIAPWLTGHSSFAWKLMIRYAPPSRVRQHIKRSDARTLNRSRAHVDFVIHTLPTIARALQARRGRGFAGFGYIAGLGAKHAAMLGTVTVALDKWPAFYRRFDLLIQGLSPYKEHGEFVLDLSAEYLRQHPDQRASLRKHGLDGLIERGLALPLDGVDDLVVRASGLQHEHGSAAAS